MISSGEDGKGCSSVLDFEDFEDFENFIGVDTDVWRDHKAEQLGWGMVEFD